MKQLTTILLAVGLLSLFSASSEASFMTVGTCDPAGDANDADQSAAFDSGTGGTSSADAGGVMDFESGNIETFGGAVNNDGGTVRKGTYAGGGKFVSFSTTDGSFQTGNHGDNRTPISGGSGGKTIGKNASRDFIFDGITIASGAAMGGTGTLRWNLDGDAADLIDVDGTLDITGLALVFDVTGGQTVGAEYVVADFTGADTPLGLGRYRRRRRRLA